MPQNNHHHGRTAALARELRDRAADAEVAALPDFTCKMNMVSGGILQRAEGPPLKFNKHLSDASRNMDLFDATQRTSPPLQRAIAAKQHVSERRSSRNSSPMSSRTSSPALKPSESPFSVLSDIDADDANPRTTAAHWGRSSRLATPQATELPEVVAPPHPPGLEWWSQLAAAVAAAVGCNGAPTSRAELLAGA